MVFKKALFKAKTSDQHISFTIFGRLELGHVIKANFMIFQTVDPEINSTLIFYKRIWD